MMTMPLQSELMLWSKEGSVCLYNYEQMYLHLIIRGSDYQMLVDTLKDVKKALYKRGLETLMIQLSADHGLELNALEWLTDTWMHGSIRNKAQRLVLIGAPHLDGKAEHGRKPQGLIFAENYEAAQRMIA